MLTKQFQLRAQLERVMDVFIAFASLNLAIVIRRELINWNPELFPVFDFWPQAGWLYVVLIALWVILFDNLGLYTNKFTRSYNRTLSILIRSNLLGIMLAVLFFYVTGIKTIPRVLIFLYAGFNIVFMCAKEVLVRAYFNWFQPPQNILLIGKPEHMEELLQRIRGLREWNANILGYLGPEPTAGPDDTVATVKHLGSMDELAQFLHEQSVNYVVMNPERERFNDIQEAINICEVEGVETWLLGSFFKTNIAKAQVDEFQDLPMLVFTTTASRSFAYVIKRVMDFFGSLVLILLTSPIMLLIAAAIRISSKGPILFRQKRCTLHGRTFTMLKFRTMVDEAEQLRDELQRMNEVDGPVFKIAKDPRITPMGRFLRRHSLDELPQLFNVVMGDMSLVGPRPPIPSEVEKYENWQRRRLSMRPGLTCLWQVSGRNSLNFSEWMALDLQYIDSWSLSLDVKIMFKTPLVMIRGTGV